MSNTERNTERLIDEYHAQLIAREHRRQDHEAIEAAWTHALIIELTNTAGTAGTEEANNMSNTNLEALVYFADGRSVRRDLVPQHPRCPLHQDEADGVTGLSIEVKETEDAESVFVWTQKACPICAMRDGRQETPARYRVARWSDDGAECRIERLETGADGRELSTGAYVKDEDGNVVTLTETTATKLTERLNLVERS